jgi:hypothetical protein
MFSLIAYTIKMKGKIIFFFVLLQSFQGLFGKIYLETDPVRTTLKTVFDHDGGNKKGFEKVVVSPWGVDQNGNTMQTIYCTGNGDFRCVGSLAQRPNPNNLDPMIEDRLNSIKADICNLYFSGQTTGSRNYSIISNDNTTGNVNICVNWTQLEGDKICIVFNFTIQ